MICLFLATTWFQDKIGVHRGTVDTTGILLRLTSSRTVWQPHGFRRFAPSKRAVFATAAVSPASPLIRCLARPSFTTERPISREQKNSTPLSGHFASVGVRRIPFIQFRSWSYY